MVMSESKAIRKKLMAATSMLLVACIMLISASYAWFTLSTAPEITGISTAVGANGNLEIALADEDTWDDPDTEVETSVGEFTQVEDKNITWGNLVELADTTTHSYGLSKITLLPARLAVTSGKTETYAVSTSPLMTPTYGTDGRIEAISPTTSYGEYSTASSSTGTFVPLSDGSLVHGVRGIGAASGMSDRQLSYRNAKIELANSMATAKKSAKDSLEGTNGDALANIIVSKAIEDANNPATYTQTDVTAVANVLADLTSAYNKLVDGWEAAVLGQAASSYAQKGDTTLNIAGLSDEDYLNFAKVFPLNEYTVDTSAKTVTMNADTTISMPLTDDLVTYWTKLEKINADITAANTEVGNLQALLNNGATIYWAKSILVDGTENATGISSALNYIVNSDNVTVNGYSKSALKENFGALAGQVAGGSGIQVQMPSGSGVYSDIADFCGDYSASVTLNNLEYNGIKIESLDATMTTASKVSPSYYSAAATTISSLGAPEADGSSNDSLTDMYGYVVDFYLRTNASSSNLLLQTTAAQRIYSESDNEDTQGSGSNMTFTSSDANFTSEQVKNLMKSIRVVFMDGEGDILGVAILDTDNATVENTTVKADLKLANYKFNQNEKGDYTSIKLVDTDTSDAVETYFLDSQVLTDLPQNTAVKVSALVYLDGDTIDNSDVATGNVKSMQGLMNLQFTSDAKLVPMEDSSLNLQSSN